MKKLALISAISLAASGQVMAAAYKLPESSINATALSAAYVANAHGADASYYNPAAMVFDTDSRAALEADLTLIHLTSISNFQGGVKIDDTKEENIPVPTFHYISPDMGNWRYGLSVVTPGGLTKRWNGAAKAAAEEFTLKTVEINPTIAYKVNDKFSIGGGARVIYSKGVVKSTKTTSPTSSRDLEGDSFDFGYNLALNYRPTDELSLALTYRSKIDLTEKGEAQLSAQAPIPGPGLSTYTYSGPASVLIPIPAALSLAAAYDISDKSTVEFVYERTYWSAYDVLDFDYSSSLNAVLAASAFATPGIKDWDDSNTYRIGLTHNLNSKWTLMAGFAYDETPAPKKYIGYELPDSDAKIYSFGAKYKSSENLTIGAAFLYDQKDKLTISAADGNATFPAGAVFEDAAAYLLTVGLEYKF
ncbi:MAG: OmpP1/FadL family transporter [Sedimenticola sp.]|nr:OmpP1/FadL family transporter [Sedimenticola sp.]